MQDIETLLVDLRILAQSAKDDFDAKRWQSYPEYTQEFNRILEALQGQGLGADIAKVEPVPPGKMVYQGLPGYGTLSEIAKLREIVDKSARLLARVKSAVAASRKSSDVESIAAVERLCTRFHSVARQLRSRRQNRPPLEIEDEYDVQDLFHALLWLFFDDIRPEEWTPSYAGGAARIDFLLKNEKIVIEIKKTRKGLGDRESGEQLIIDIEKYAKHPDCKTLMCFVYDPEGRIANPRGVEADLMSRSTAELQVLVFIRPTAQ